MDINPEDDEEPLICMICEDKATGLHYGIITCEGWVLGNLYLSIIWIICEYVCVHTWSLILYAVSVTNMGYEANLEQLYFGSVGLGLQMNSNGGINMLCSTYYPLGYDPAF